MTWVFYGACILTGILLLVWLFGSRTDTQCLTCGRGWSSYGELSHHIKKWHHLWQSPRCGRYDLPFWQILVEAVVRRHIWSKPEATEEIEGKGKTPSQGK